MVVIGSGNLPGSMPELCRFSNLFVICLDYREICLQNCDLHQDTVSFREGSA